MLRFPLCLTASGGLLASTFASAALATIAYTPVALPPGAVPSTGPGLISPDLTFGKEYSHDLDQSTAGAGGLPDPEQVIAWDGIGGAADGVDFSGTRGPNFEDSEVDAIANHNDALFTRLRRDDAHLIFSHDDRISGYAPGGASFFPVTVPSGGPITLSGGNVIGGAGELSYELGGVHAPTATMGLWASQAEINGMPNPIDVDGVEVWGPEPGTTGDSDKYSLDVDAFTVPPTGGAATSIWNLSGTPYISHGTIVAAVTSVLGPLPPGVVLPYPDLIDGDAAINVDALMVRDTVGEIDSFDRDPNGDPGDQIIFSIRQILDPSDTDGYYATGSELFVLDATTGVAGTSYLHHGGHDWSHSFALTDLAITGPDVQGRAIIDINAIEAVGQLVVPEPTTAMLSLLGLATVVGGRRRRR